MFRKNCWLLTIKLVFAILLIFMSGVPVKADIDLRSALVKIYVTQVAPDYFSPWEMLSAETINGSGCIISGNRIITNAHVVSDQKFIQVRKFGDANRFKAKVIAVSHETDLALLTVENDRFFKGIKPLKLGNLPLLQEDVYVYGFPEGGDTLSITKGVVSRVEHHSYVHSSNAFLALQIDAAVNGGNSGGPVISNDRIAGIVMQSMTDAENTSYAVPVLLVEHFLKDLEDGVHNGMPGLCLRFQHLENPSLRQKYGIPDNKTGVLVSLSEDTAAGSITGILQDHDIILKIDNQDVANDGSIEFRKGERTSMKFHVDKHQVGEKIEIELLRNSEKRTVSIGLAHENCSLVPREQYDHPPSYYIFGGLVFSPLTKNYLLSWGEKWREEAPTELKFYYSNIRKNKDIREVVTIIKVLPHDVNVGYLDMEDYIVESVNDVRIRDLEHLIMLVENTKSRLLEFKLRDGERIVLDRRLAAEAKATILENYGVHRDRL